MKTSATSKLHSRAGIAAAAAIGLIAGVLAVVSAASPASSVGPVYVDQTAVGGANNGSSWADAFTDLQGAFAVAASGDETRVAEGTYTPHASDRSVSFALVNGVNLRGGFQAGGGAGPDPVAYPTILSGDLDDNDLPGFVNVDENTVHVITADSTIADHVVLDGFTITGGNANLPFPDDNGAGLHLLGGSPEPEDPRLGTISLLNSAVRNHRADRGGAGIWVENHSLTLGESVVSDNAAGDYGG